MVDARYWMGKNGELATANLRSQRRGYVGWYVLRLELFVVAEEAERAKSLSDFLPSSLTLKTSGHRGHREHRDDEGRRMNDE